MVHQHILLVTFPAQGHLNPSLQFGKLLTEMGIQVTFVTGEFAGTRMTEIPKGLSLATFYDGYDEDYKRKDDGKNLMSEMRSYGSQTLTKIIISSKHEGCPVTCLVYTLLLPWAADVARHLQIPSALLWIQPASVFNIYYYYFNGNGITTNKGDEDDDFTINLPGLPKLTTRDLPSFLLPGNSDKHNSILQTFKQHMDQLEAETYPSVLVNTFDELEMAPLNALEGVKMISVGPLIPSAFVDGKDPSDTCFGGDLFQQHSMDYIKWLNSKPPESVVYVSFGSLLTLPKVQMEEIARGLLTTGRPFLWVIRGEEKPSCLEDLQQQGMIVTWCSQLKVLSHPSLGCFVTHCGWNSTLESLVSGVPMVAFPQWTDQGTTAKLIEDVWETGVRVKTNNDKQGGIVESGEIKRCIGIVFGAKGEKIRTNAKKWKLIACQATKEGGSSHNNLHDFVQHFAQDRT